MGATLSKTARNNEGKGNCVKMTILLCSMEAKAGRISAVTIILALPGLSYLHISPRYGSILLLTEPDEAIQPFSPPFIPLSIIFSGLDRSWQCPCRHRCLWQFRLRSKERFLVARCVRCTRIRDQGILISRFVHNGVDGLMSRGHRGMGAVSYVRRSVGRYARP
jgi:hypothetical protein